ncbi:hypothetical protein pipiens_004721 [Culex pipiens pipiens]|uniref:Uncharacterized protein n=1 Tax=Culex pipiens pipiens TaxID=38569 RepID=A0ABD1CFS0_CULPP
MPWNYRTTLSRNLSCGRKQRPQDSIPVEEKDAVKTEVTTVETEVTTVEIEVTTTGTAVMEIDNNAEEIAEAMVHKMHTLPKKRPLNPHKGEKRSTWKQKSFFKFV